MTRKDDIAVIGFSFKLPQGVDDDAAFWEMLQGRRNMKTGWPKSRINVDTFVNNKHHKVSDGSGRSQILRLADHLASSKGKVRIS